MFKTILFDIDGTLIDTEQVIIQSLQQVLKTQLHLTVSAEKLTFVLGIPGATALQRFTADPAQIQRLGAQWSALAATMTQQYRVFPQVQTALQQLYRQVPLGIITSKNRGEFTREFTPFGLNDYFQLVVTASDTTQHKPDPAPLQYAAQQLKRTPIELLYVGDTVYDLQCAHAAGAQFALATWGAHADSALQQADFQLATPCDLCQLIEERTFNGNEANCSRHRRPR